MFVEVESSGAVSCPRRASPGLSDGGEFFCVSAKIFLSAVSGCQSNWRAGEMASKTCFTTYFLENLS